MAKTPHPRAPKHSKAIRVAGNKKAPRELAPADNTEPSTTGGPQFAQSAPTPDPTKFIVKHASDKEAYTILDSEKGTLLPREIPVGPEVEPQMSLADAIGGQGQKVEKAIKAAGQIVFHSLGDTGNTRSAKAEDLVTDKLVSDFDGEDSKAVPSFCFNLGDIVYSFGEAAYYYDQFYDPYRDYPAPIFAIAGNHDGMVAPNTSTPTLQAFLANFCDYQTPEFHRTPEAGNLVRTAGKQPGVYFTLEAPFVRILALYSNCLEDPGVISSQKDSGQPYPALPDVQLDFLNAALQRIKAEKFAGAVLIAVHHPAYVAVTAGDVGGKHIGSPLMLADIDKACSDNKVWPHAILSGHAHNYQRFTRYQDDRETPFIICGNGGHAHARLTKKGTPALRTPVTQAELSNGNDSVVFENYDDTEYGYLRVIVDEAQLHIEYHPASDGEAAKTPDDSVTVNLETRKLIPYKP